MKNIAIVGARGNTGKKLISLLINRKDVNIQKVISTSCVGEVENLTGLKYESLDFNELNQLDLVFLAVPHGGAKDILPKINTKVIDLSADHRTVNTYGLPEIFSDEIKKATIVANPGCYATASILSVYPIKDFVDYVIFDCISGYSGAGKNAKDKFDFEKNIIAYNLTNHFHIVEIEKITKLKISFTPHVVDIFAGLMCTAHIFLNKKITSSEIKDIYYDFYQDSNTKITQNIPSTKEVVETSYCRIGGFELDKNNQLVVVSTIDNLYKGASSQAIENMDLMLFGSKIT